MSCFKGTETYFLRTQTLEQTAELISKKNVNMKFDKIQELNYAEVLQKIKGM